MASVKIFPDFAIVCSFLERYGEHLQLPEVSIVDLETAIGYAHCVPPLLKDIIIKLMRKTRKSFTLEKWQRYLAKMCRERFSEVAAWEVERFGFAASKPQIKIAVLRFLCESQFDDNIKFKAIVNDEDPDKMRVEPMGRDKMGLVYWFQKDEDTNIRIYREEQDDPDSSTWEVISSDRNQMENLITALKSGTNVVSGQGKDEDTESTSSDSSSAKSEAKKGNGQAKSKQDSAISETSKETSEKDSEVELKESGDKTGDIEDGAGDNHPEVKEGKRTIDEDKDVGHENDDQKEKVDVITENEVKQKEKDEAKEEQSGGPTDAVESKTEDGTGTQCKKEKEEDMGTQVKEETVEDEKGDLKEVEETSPKVELQENKVAMDGDSKDGVIETKKEDPETESSKQKAEGGSEDSGDQDEDKNKDDQRGCQEGTQGGTKADLNITKDVDGEAIESHRKEQMAQDEEAGGKAKEDQLDDDDEEDNKPLAKLKKTQKKCKKKSTKSRFMPRRNASRKAAVKIEVEMKEEVEEEKEGVEDEKEEEDCGPVGDDDSPCCKCGQYNHPEWILLCDKCDSGYHTACLRPPLMVIPDGNWFCPSCEHEKLIVRLLETLTDVDTSLKKKERKRKRKDGEGLWALTDICMRNILPGEMIKVKKQRHGVALRHTSGFRRKKPRTSRDGSRSRHHQRHQRSSRSRRDRSLDGERHWRQGLRDRSFINDNEDEDDEEEDEFEIVQRRSRRTKKEISYKFEDFDTAINTAIQDEVVEHKKAVKEYQATRPINRGKDISTIEGMKDSSEEESKEDQTRRKMKRRLGDLDATSEEEEGSEDFTVESNPASDQDYENEEGDEEVEDDSYISEESDSDGPRRKRSKRYSKWNSLPKRRSERRQKRVRYRDISEDEEFESESDQYSEYSEESDVKSRRRKSAGRRRDSSGNDDESEDSSNQSDQSGSTKRKPKIKRRVESDTESSENTGYVRKRKFRLESDNEDDENDDGTEEKKAVAKNDSSSEEEQESGPVVRKKVTPVERNKRKRDTEDSDCSLSDTVKRASRYSSKRIDYRKMAAESDSDEEEEDDSHEEKEEEAGREEDGENKDEKKSDEDTEEKEEDSRTETNNDSAETEKDSNKENERAEKQASRDTKAKESLKKAEDYATKSAVPPPVSNGTTLNGGETIINGNGASGNREGMTTGEDEDEDLLGVTDLVEYVTQDV